MPMSQILLYDTVLLFQDYKIHLRLTISLFCLSSGRVSQIFPGQFGKARPVGKFLPQQAGWLLDG